MTSTRTFDTLNVILSFLLSRWLYMDYLYHFSQRILIYDRQEQDFWVPFLSILILTFLVFSLFRLLYLRKMTKINFYCLYLIYGLVLFALLYLKSPGVSGYNFDLRQTLYEATQGGSWVPLLNILMFVPLGSLFVLKGKNLLTFLIFIVIVEVSQALLYLGFCDIGDMLLNTFGFFLGNLIHMTPLGQFIKKKMD